MDAAPASGRDHGERVRLVGDPVLREICQPVGDARDEAFAQQARRLVAGLEAFRAEHGFGRAISAPQLGITRRMIAMNLGQGPFVMVDPRVTWRAAGTFTLWDDCMSFPFLVVKVRRHRSISVEFDDERGERHRWERIAPSLSELVQHEVDHLDGVLALDRALGNDALVAREVFEARRSFFERQVDYVIAPTVREAG